MSFCVWHGCCVARRSDNSPSISSKGMPMTFFAKTVATLTLVCSTFSGTTFADTYHHIDELAVTIERQARMLEREVSLYRHVPEYRYLLVDTRRLASLAEHMHEVAHNHGCIAHLEADLRHLDSAFHHLERTIEQIQDDSFRGHCRLPGATLHVRRLMHSMESNIHHLQDDVRSLSRSRHHDDHYSPARSFGRVDSRFYSPWPPQRSRGITIGGGSSRFTIRF